MTEPDDPQTPDTFQAPLSARPTLTPRVREESAPDDPAEGAGGATTTRDRPRPPREDRPEGERPPRRPGDQSERRSGDDRPRKPRSRKPAPTPTGVLDDLQADAGGIKPAGDEPYVYKVRDLKPATRWVVLAIIVIAVFPFAHSAYSAWRDNWVPAGDNALIALRVDDVFTSRTPQTGQPSTSAQYGAVATAHPGPFEFWILAVPSAVLGPSLGMLLGAVFINGAAVVLFAFVGFRRQGLVFGLWCLAVMAALSWGLGSNFLHDPISSSIASIPVMLLLILAWSMWLGDVRLLPLTAVVASFVFQDHLSFLGHNTLLAASTLVAFVVVVVLRKRRTDDEAWAGQRRDLLKYGGIAAGLALVIWSPVLSDELFGTHNLSNILKAYQHNSGNAKGAGFALDRVAGALGPLPTFLKHHPKGTLDFLKGPDGFSKAVAFLPLLIVIGLAAYFIWDRRKGPAMLMVTAVVGLVSGAYSAMSLPAKGGAELQQSAMRWMWTAGAFLWLALLWGLWCLVPARSRRRAGFAAAGALAALVLVVSAITVTTYSSTGDRDAQVMPGLAEAMPKVRAALEPGASYAMMYSGLAALTGGPGVAFDLENHGHDIYAPYFFTDAYGIHRTFTGKEKVAGGVYVLEGQYVGPKGTKLVTIIPVDNKLDKRFAPLMAEGRQVLKGLKVTAKGRALADSPSSATTDDQKAIALLIDDPDLLLHAGLLSKAQAGGYVEGIPDSFRDRYDEAFAVGENLPFDGVFVGVAPEPQPKPTKPAAGSD
jgi:hypothetical protein